MVPEADEQSLIGGAEGAFGEGLDVQAMFSIEAGLAVADVNDQSEAQGEIGRLAEEAYRLGVNSFILKPFSSSGTSKTILSFLDYWFNCVELPAVSVYSLSLKGTVD